MSRQGLALVNKTVSFVLIGLVTSCGARSNLLPGEPSSSGGAGGTVSTGGSGGTVAKDSGGPDGTSGAGGSAGAGGVAGQGGGACPGLMLQGSPTEVKGDSWTNATHPMLQSASDDDTVSALIVEGYPIESPGPVAARLQVAAFHPWMASWPPYDLGVLKQASTTTGIGQTVFARGSADGVLAMAWPGASSPPNPEPTGVVFVPDFSPYSGSWSTSAVNLVSETSISQLSAFATRAGGEHVVGYSLKTEAGHVLRTSRVKTGSITEDPTILACGSGDLSAAAQWNGQQVLLAASSSRTPLGCTADSGPGDLVEHLTVVSRSLDGTALQVLHDSVIAGDAVAWVDLKLHDTGAWVAYQYMGLNAEVQPPVMLMRIDAVGGIQAGPLSVVEGYLMTGEVAVAQMNHRVAIAWVEPATEGYGAQIQIRLFNEDGSIAAPYTIGWGDGLLTGRLSLLGSPQGDKLLVAWSVAPLGGGMLDVTWVARLDCGLP